MPLVTDGSCSVVPHFVGVGLIAKSIVPPFAMSVWSIDAWSRATPLTESPAT